MLGKDRQRRRPAGRRRREAEGDRIATEDPPLDCVAELDQPHCTRRLALRGEALGQRLLGQMGDPVDRGHGVPVDVASKTDHGNAGLRERRAGAFGHRIGGDAGIALEIVVAGLSVARDRHVADDEERPVGGLRGARQPEQVLFAQHEAVAVGVAMDLRIRPPKRDTPVAEVERHRFHRLAEDGLVVGDLEMVAVVVAVEVVDRRGDLAKRLADFLLEDEVGLPVLVGDPVAEVEHEIGTGLGGEAREFLHQRKRGIASLGCGGLAVMDVGNDADTDGHEFGSRCAAELLVDTPPAWGRRRAVEGVSSRRR